MTGPLAGRCIVTTRPAGQEGGLARALQAQGAEVLNFPVIAIETVSPNPLATLTLTDYDLAFFVSPNAVEHALATVAHADWPVGLKVATVGPASTLALQEKGFREVIRPISSFDSEAVLALPEFAPAEVAGTRILILRGNGGRELLADTLRERGARVEQVSCYHRVCGQPDPTTLLHRFHGRQIAALVFSASEGVRYFVTILGQEGSAMLATLPCFAPHPRIGAALHEAGVPSPQLTASGDEGITGSIARFFTPT